VSTHDAQRDREPIEIPDPPVPQVVESIRRDVARWVNEILQTEGKPLARLRSVLARMLADLEATPKLARVLFVTSKSQEEALANALRRLQSMLRNLIVVLVRDAQAAGQLRAGSAEEMVSLLWAGLEAAVSECQSEGRSSGLIARGERLLDLWLDGVVGDGSVTRSRQERTLDVSELDVRPILAAGQDPLDTIQTALEGLSPGSVLHILTPFRPQPLETFLASAGHTVDITAVGDDFSVAVVVGGGCDIVDLRELEPPGPLEAVLTATVHGGPFVARLPRIPRLLIPQLEQRGAEWRLIKLEDETALIWVAP
jgi:hypothetical protein